VKSRFSKYYDTGIVDNVFSAFPMVGVCMYKKFVTVFWCKVHRPLISFCFLTFSYYTVFMLLERGMITSSEFVTLTITGTCGSLILLFAPLVSEITIAGNVIKLREAKADADKSITELNSARVAMLVAIISTLKRSVLHLNETLGRADDRASQFLELYKANRDLKTHYIFRQEVLSAANVFKQVSFQQILQTYYFPSEAFSTGCTPDVMERLHIEKYGKDVPLTPIFQQYRELYSLVEELS
jgi:hypothetical protein